MPFKKPYSNFKKGDLIYGLKDPRANFIKSFGFNPLEGGHTIDNYSIFQYEFSDRKQIKYKHPQDQNKFKKALKKHHYYKCALKDDNAPTEHKCKGGLYWATFSKVEKNVHFLLDEISQTDVVKKIGNYGKSITASELRWVYRFREHPNIQNRIQFWLNSKQCCPPWKNPPGQSLWPQYSPTRSRNIHGASLVEDGDYLDLSSFQDDLAPSSGLRALLCGCF